MAELVWAKKIFCLTVVIVKDNKVFKLNWTCSWNNVCRKAWQTPAWETCKWISKDGTLKPWIKIHKRSYPQISSPSPIIFSYHLYLRSAFTTSPELSPPTHHHHHHPYPHRPMSSFTSFDLNSLSHQLVWILPLRSVVLLSLTNPLLYLDLTRV